MAPKLSTLRPRIIAAGAVGALRRLEPGCQVAVWYDDDGVWHHRLLLWPIDEGRCIWVVLTPDGDSYVEDISGNDATGCSRVAVLGLAGERPSLPEGLYAFADVPSGDALVPHIQDALEVAAQKCLRGHCALEMTAEGCLRGHCALEMAAPGCFRGHCTHEMAVEATVRWK